MADEPDSVEIEQAGPDAVLMKVKLTSKAHAALIETAKITGRSRTDEVNRALQIHAFIEARRAEGFDLGFSKDSEFRHFKID